MISGMSLMGLQRFVASVAAEKASLDKRVDKGLERAANDCARTARSLAPVGETGRLRASIEPLRLREKTWLVRSNPAMVSKSRSGIPYPVFAEYGTHKMAGRFFFRQAREETAARLINYFR